MAMESEITVEGKQLKHVGRSWHEFVKEIEADFRERHPDADVTSLFIKDTDDNTGYVTYTINAVVT